MKKIDYIDKNLKKEKINLLKLRKYIEKNFEFVGKNFGKKSKRNLL